MQSWDKPPQKPHPGRMETQVSFHAIPLTDLPVVAELVAFLLALMGADEELQVVLLKDLPCHVRSKVAATTSHRIYSAALLRDGVTPENV